MKNNVALEFITLNNKQYLQFMFYGHLNESSAVSAITDWKAKMNSSQAGSGKTNLIYNCREMTGFDTVARRNWQTTMSDLKGKVGVIWIIADNIFILGAAKTMGVLTGFDIKVARTMQEIK